MLLCAVLPTYDSGKKTKEPGKQVVKADDPANDELIDRLLG